MSSDPKNLVGTTLSGRYKVERPIGEGGMGAVFEATQLSLGRRVAIKVVKPASAGSTDEEVMKRFERETEVISRLNHPNIVQVVDGGRADDGVMYLAMELLDGESVRMVLKRDGAIPVGRALAIVEDVLSALVAAHGGGVIHRDLKAENVMMVQAAGKAEIAKVLDFGVAKVTTQTEAPPVTGSGFVAGTPGCIAPEQMLGKNDDPRSDLYSVGVLLFEMLAGQGPFVAGNSMELMMKHLTEPAPRVADVARGRGKAEVPGPVDELVASLLAKDPEMRPASAQAALEVVRGLRDAGRSTQPDVRVPVPTPQGGFFPLGSRVVAMPGVSGQTSPSGVTVPAVPATALSPTSTSSQTSPTTAMPLPATSPPVTRLKKVLRAALVVGVVLSVASAAGKLLSWDADRFSRVKDADQLIAAAIVDYQNLDTKAARAKVNKALQIDPKGAAMGYLLRAQLNILDEGPLARVDEDSGLAMQVAKARSAAMAIQTHTEGIALALSTLDPDGARAAFENHETTHRCFHDPLHHQMFALRYGAVNPDQQTVEAMFLDEDSGYTHLLTAYGVARARFRGGDLSGARQVMNDHVLPRGAGNVLVENLLADLDLAEGRVEDAMKRFKRVVLDTEDLRTKIRLAALEADKRRDAFNDVIQRVETTLSPGAQERIDTWALLGHLYATTGRMGDAKRMWARAYDESVEVEDSIGRRLELVVFAELFSVLLGDLTEAERLRRLFDREYKILGETPGAERLRALSIANSILIDVIDIVDGQGEQGRATSESIARDLQGLRNTRADIPLIVPATEWHVLVAEGKLSDALAAANALGSPCWSHAWVGETALARLKRATTEEERRAARADARAAFTVASSDQIRNTCTRTFDLLSWLQTVVYARTIARRALAAEPLDAAQLVEVIAAYERVWPYADDDTGVGRVITLARKELGLSDHVHAPAR